MKKKLFLSLLGIAVLVSGLTACGPVYDTSYTYVQPKAWRGKQCANRCLRDRSYCRSNCQSRDQSCRNTANLAATPAYLAYLEQQKQQNFPLDRNVTNFADYSRCTDRCGCQATYRECFTNCGGEVVASIRCVAFCKKSKNIGN